MYVTVQHSGRNGRKCKHTTTHYNNEYAPAQIPGHWKRSSMFSTTSMLSASNTTRLYSVKAHAEAWASTCRTADDWSVEVEPPAAFSSGGVDRVSQ